MAMTARDKFVRGQRVQMTQEAIQQGLDGLHQRRTGVVKGFSLDNIYVRIHRDGDSERLIHTYSVDFWEPIP